MADKKLNVTASQINEIVNKADKSMVDGQWVFNRQALITNNTIPKTNDYEYDLTNYLPKDDNNYEILLFGFVSPANTVGSSINLLVATDYTGKENNIAVTYGVRQIASVDMYCQGTATIPVGTQRKIYIIKRPSDNGTYSIYVSGYRRLGKNL